MTEPTEQPRNEVTAEEMFPEESAYEQWYAKVRDDLRTLTDQESTASLRYKHAIGMRIMKARHELQKIVPVKDEKGWNKELGKLTERLEKELDYKASTLNYCFRFAQFYPSWDEFAQTEFPVVRGSSNRLENPTKVPGGDLYWTELIHELEDDTRKEDEEGAKKPASRKKVTPKPSKSFWDYLTPVAVEVRDKFIRIAEQQGKHPEELVADIIQDYVRSHSQ